MFFFLLGFRAAPLGRLADVQFVSGHLRRLRQACQSATEHRLRTQAASTAFETSRSLGVEDAGIKAETQNSTQIQKIRSVRRRSASCPVLSAAAAHARLCLAPGDGEVSDMRSC